jgi:hypothetical protein
LRWWSCGTPRGLRIADHHLGPTRDLGGRVAEALQTEPRDALVARQVACVPVLGPVVAAVALRVPGRSDQVQVGTRHEPVTVQDLDLGLDRPEPGERVFETQNGLPPRLAALVRQDHRPSEPGGAIGLGPAGSEHVAPGRRAGECAVDHRHEIHECEVACQLEERLRRRHQRDAAYQLDLGVLRPPDVQALPLHVHAATRRGKRHVRPEPVRHPPTAQCGAGEVAEAAVAR